MHRHVNFSRKIGISNTTTVVEVAIHVLLACHLLLLLAILLVAIIGSVHVSHGRLGLHLIDEELLILASLRSYSCGPRISLALSIWIEVLLLGHRLLWVLLVRLLLMNKLTGMLARLFLILLLS